MSPWRASLTAFVLSIVACRRAPPAPVATPDDPPPSRPEGVVALARISNARNALEALGEAAGTRLPADLLLVGALGVDVAVSAAVDTSRPVDVALLAGERRGYVFAMTPPGNGYARSQLAARYRFLHVEGLGEALVLRGDPQAHTDDRRVPCALVRVPDRVSARVVCGSDDDALRRAGRFIAYESAARRGSEGDLELRIAEDGPRVAGRLIRDATARAQQGLMADASRARRQRERAPDYGDPEPLIAALSALCDDVATTVEQASEFTLRATIRRGSVDVTVEARLPLTGGGAIAADARSRCGLGGDHPLAAALPADAVLALASRAPSAGASERMLETIIRVLGARVSAPDAMRADLTALTAHTGDALCFAVSRDSPRGLELSLALSQTDEGAGARVALARIANAPWLRALRVGPPLVMAPLQAGWRATSGSAPESPSLSMGVRASSLVAVWGAHSSNTLEGFAARARSTLPPSLAGLSGSLVASLDLGALTTPGAAPARLSYSPRCDRETVRATLHLEVPLRALGALAAVWE